MATDRRQQQRALDAAEFARVETTMHPAIAGLSDAELGETIAWLRERRDRARSLANRQRRAVRGKGERGAGAAGFDQADAGNREKARVLSEAVSRAGKERTRRAQKASRARLVETAQNALIRKAEKPAPRRPKSGRTAGEGMHPVDREKTIAPRERSFP